VLITVSHNISAGWDGMGTLTNLGKSVVTYEMLKAMSEKTK
jgi:hypothetical protein